MISGLVKDQLCEEGQRLLTDWLEPADADWDEYNPFDHPVAHQRAEAYSMHRWGCLTCIQTIRQTAEYMRGTYLADVDARIEELQMQAQHQ